MKARKKAIARQNTRASEKKPPGQAYGKTAELSRRSFVGAAATAVATSTVAPRFVLADGSATSPSEKLNIAFIGVGCQGLRILKAFVQYPDTRVVAVCDVNAGSNDYRDFDYKDGIAGREPARKIVDRCYAQGQPAGSYKGCAAYRDFREMLEKEKDIDAVVVATPDHSHATVCMRAIKLGKHVYCEKPLTRTIHEARKLVEAAREAKVATQMGIQIHCDDGLRLQVEMIRSGAIGDVHRVHAWCAASGWKGLWSGVYQRRWAVHGSAPWKPPGARPDDTPPVPDNLDWDLWLGPAPDRPYHPAYLPFKWRGWWAFSNGGLGDMACHIMDPVFWALGLGHPTAVEASSTAVNSETVPLASMVHYKFPRRGDMPPLELTWYSGGLKPPRPEELEEGGNLPAQGVLYVGEKGKLLAGLGGGPRLLPESRMKEFKPPEPFLPRTKSPVTGSCVLSGHHREWIDGCKGGPAGLANFDYAGPLTEAALLGAIAVRTGKRLNWDGPNMKVTNVPEANQYVHTPYRKGWTL